MTKDEIVDSVKNYFYISNADLKPLDFLAILKDIEYFEKYFNWNIFKSNISEENKLIFYKELRKVFLKYITVCVNEKMDNEGFWDVDVFSDKDKKKPISQEEINPFYFVGSVIYAIDDVVVYEELRKLLKPIVYNVFIERFKEHFNYK